MAELKPCPFCGGKAELHHKTEAFCLDGYSYVYCTKCRVKTEAFPKSYEHSSDGKAIEAWNRRSEPQQELEFDYEAED